MNRSYEDSYAAELAQCQLEEQHRYETEAAAEMYFDEIEAYEIYEEMEDKKSAV